MSVKNFVQCGLVTPIATNTTELVLNTPAAPYQLPPLDGGTLVIADSVARPSFYEIISYTHRIDNVIYGVVRAKEGTTARAWTGTTWVYQALTAADYIAALMLKADLDSAQLTGLPTAPTAALGTNTNQIATMAAIKQAIDALINGAPGALDALNEFATALGNDPNFATTMTNALAGKEPNIAAGTSAQMWLGNKTWASVLSQVQGTLLTGLPAGSNTTIVAADSLITALAKIQNQLNNKCASNDSRLSDSREWTAATVTQAVAEAGTDTARTAWTAQRVAQAVRGGLLTGLNLTVSTAVAATDTVLVAIGKLQKQITDAATNLAGNVRATVLTGYVLGSNSALAATDSVLGAFQKVQAQLNAKQDTLGYTPVQQGTGVGQSTSVVKVGWSASGLLLTVDATDFANSWPINISKNAASASKLATARNINGVPFDGTSDITIAIGETGRLPLSGGTLTGILVHSDVGAVQSVTDSWRYNGVQVWNMGREANGDFSLWYYNDAGTYQGGFSFNRSGGFTALGSILAGGNVTAYSDVRLKTNIETINSALSKIGQLRGVTYTRIDLGEEHTGLLAQDVQAVLPQAVQDDGEYLSVAYGNLVGLLVEGIKELKAELDALKAEREVV